MPCPSHLSPEKLREERLIRLCSWQFLHWAIKMFVTILWYQHSRTESEGRGVTENRSKPIYSCIRPQNCRNKAIREENEEHGLSPRAEIVFCMLYEQLKPSWRSCCKGRGMWDYKQIFLLRWSGTNKNNDFFFQCKTPLWPLGSKKGQ